MKFRRVLLVLFVSLVLAYLFKAVMVLRPFASVSGVGLERCRLVSGDGLVGAEDLEFDHRSATLYIAAANRRDTGSWRPDPGAIFRWEVEQNRSKKPEKMPIEGMTEALRPHGMSLYTHPSGTRHLFVVHHSRRAEMVLVFRIVSRNGQETLQLLREVQAPQFVSLNDVAGAGLFAFYATNDHGRRAGFGHALEDFAFLSRASVMYFDGTWVNTQVAGLRYANGVQLSADQKWLLVAETLGYRIQVFRRLPDGKLEFVQRRKLDTTPDNFSQDENGNFLLAAHPSPFAFLLHAGSADERAPSEVLRFGLTETGETREIATILRDPETLLSASSVAAQHGKYLVVGGVFDKGILLCEQDRGKTAP